MFISQKNKRIFFLDSRRFVRVRQGDRKGFDTFILTGNPIYFTDPNALVGYQFEFIYRLALFLFAACKDSTSSTTTTRIV